MNRGTMGTMSLTIPSQAQVIVPGAVALVKGWLQVVDADQLGSLVVSETFNRWQGQLKFGRGGRFFDRGHTMCRHGDAGITYSFKGKAKPMYPMTPTLCDIRDRIARTLAWRPNCVVTNSYAPGSGLYPHRDSTYIPQLGANPTIVAVSFGATRTFQLLPHDPVANKYVKSRPTIDLDVGHGDLLIMHGTCDSQFKHGIPEQPNTAGTRVSLTFRHHLS